MYFYNNYSLKSFFFFFYEEWVRAFSHRARWIRESLYTVWPSTLISCGQPRGVAVKELKAMLLCGVLYQSGGCDPAFITQIMFPGASSTGSAWYENEREAGSGLFSFHTGPKQNTCQRKTLLSPFLSLLLSCLQLSLNYRNLLMFFDGK